MIIKTDSFALPVRILRKGIWWEVPDAFLMGIPVSCSQWSIDHPEGWPSPEPHFYLKIFSLSLLKMAILIESEISSLPHSFQWIARVNSYLTECQVIPTLTSNKNKVIMACYGTTWKQAYRLSPPVTELRLVSPLYPQCPPTPCEFPGPHWMRKLNMRQSR